MCLYTQVHAYICTCVCVCACTVCTSVNGYTVHLHVLLCMHICTSDGAVIGIASPSPLSSTHTSLLPNNSRQRLRCRRTWTLWGNSCPSIQCASSVSPWYLGLGREELTMCTPLMIGLSQFCSPTLLPHCRVDNADWLGPGKAPPQHVYYWSQVRCTTGHFWPTPCGHHGNKDTCSHLHGHHGNKGSCVMHPDTADLCNLANSF